MDPLRRSGVMILWPAACVLLALAACTPTPPVAIGPEPAPCTDSIAARVARTPPESVTVADREHALWAQAQCQLARDSATRAARQQAAAAPAVGQPGTGAAAASSSWPPPACEDSIAKRVARLPADSVSEADRAHARAAREACEQALASPPPPAGNPASANPTAVILIGALVVVVLAFAL